MASWEVGRTEPANDSLKNIVDYFNFSTDYLLGRNNFNQSISLSKEERNFESLTSDGKNCVFTFWLGFCSIHFYENQILPPPPKAKNFVQVIFDKDSTNRYDYRLGNKYDVKVGDFLEVRANNKRSGKSEWKVVKVVYVSKPGEVSKKANSTIIKKAAYPKWK